MSSETGDVPAVAVLKSRLMGCPTYCFSPGLRVTGAIPGPRGRRGRRICGSGTRGTGPGAGAGNRRSQRRRHPPSRLRLRLDAASGPAWEPHPPRRGISRPPPSRRCDRRARGEVEDDPRHARRGLAELRPAAPWALYRVHVQGPHVGPRPDVLEVEPTRRPGSEEELLVAQRAVRLDVQATGRLFP